MKNRRRILMGLGIVLLLAFGSNAFIAEMLADNSAENIIVRATENIKENAAAEVAENKTANAAANTTKNATANEIENATANEKEKASPKITLEEVLSVGSFDDDTLYQWVGVVADPYGQIYVTDAMDCSIKKFSADGKLLLKAGRKGQGPGEFLAPRLLTRSDDYLFVTDQSVPGVQVFDHNLMFVHRIPIKIPIGDVQVLSDDRIAVVALLLDRSGSIHIYNQRGRILKQIPYTEGKRSSMMDWIEIGFDDEDDLYVAYNFQDRIEKFDAGGKRLWSRSLLDLKKIKTKIIGPWKVPDKIIFKDLVFDTHERLYILGGGYSKNPSRDVYVLDRYGQRLSTFTLPESSHCIYIDSNDFLYSRANDGITLKKYRIKWPNV